MVLAAWTPRALSILRIVTGLLFLQHGTGKLLGFPPSDHTAPTPFSLIGVQGARTCRWLSNSLGFSLVQSPLSSRVIWPWLTSWPMRRRASSPPSTGVSSPYCSALSFSTWGSQVVG